MGGIRENANFRLNCAAWNTILPDSQLLYGGIPYPEIRLAPITGGMENVGYPDETAFYFDLLNASYQAGLPLSIGDGCPDIKLQSGIHAAERIQETDPAVRPAVFIKPYENRRILERIEWSRDVAGIIGIDIDSYNILTMRNLVKLERKNAARLRELKKTVDLPFAIKGVFTREDIELMREVLPDIAIISNHGGRVETRTGSTAEFLAEYGQELSRLCGEVWVDGGLRTTSHIIKAGLLGAKTIMLGRPVLSALCSGGPATVKKLADSLRLAPKVAEARIPIPVQ
jgi:isopentenyl diphosphate isomerase/L-lactate dehydrogenase-like FMN-dependent dehydrogenase